VKLFRTLSTTRLIAIAVVVLAVAVGGGFAVAATGGSGPTPAPKPLAQAVHDALAGQKPDGITANIGFTNTLFPSGSIVGQAGSSLMSSATGRLWVNANGGRLELQSDAGDAQIVWSDKKVTVYDATSNTAYVADLPASKGSDARAADKLVDEAVANQRAFWDMEEKRLVELRKILSATQTARLLVVLPPLERKIENQLRKAVQGKPAAAGPGPGARRAAPPDDEEDDDR